MGIIKSIPMGLKLFRCIRKYNPYLAKVQALKDSGDVVKERELIADATGKWVDEVIDIFDLEVNVEGRENIPMDEPCVFICNHEGYGDIFVLFRALAGKQVGYVAKDALKKVPYFGKWIEMVRGVFIQRGDPRAALKSISSGVNLIKQGFSLAIFPEGTRSRGPVMNEFKAGSFKLATKAKVPVVPISLNGTYHLYEETSTIRKGAVIDIYIHPPIDTKSLDRHETATLPVTVENIIRSKFDELVKKEELKNKGGK